MRVVEDFLEIEIKALSKLAHPAEFRAKFVCDQDRMYTF
jgi:hypothetical protein